MLAAVQAQPAGKPARWLNVLAGLILGALLVLSGVLVVTTAFTHLHAGAVMSQVADPAHKRRP